MGQAVAEAFPEARATFEAADAALGVSLAQTCFCGTEADLARTETTQPAILTTSIAIWRVLAARGFRPDGAAGHSLGEYSAHVAAGTFAFDDAVRAVRERGRLMQAAVPAGVGAMAAILGLDAGTLARLCDAAAGAQVVAPANLNGAGQVVVAGHREAVARVVAAALDAGAKRAVELPVSAPFHCVLMRPAAERLEPVLRAVAFADPAFPVYTNVDAAAVAGGDAAREALLRQVVAPVRWEESVERMLRDGFDVFVEIGPGKVLSGLIRRIARDVRVVAVSEPAGIEEALRVLEAAR
jgi:[acyl-carrier-protein] S-malonyltransferase